MKVAWLIGVLIALYLLLWPVPIAPVSWQSPANNGFEGEFAENTRLSDLTLIDLGDDYGPEDLALNHEGTSIFRPFFHWMIIMQWKRSMNPSIGIYQVSILFNCSSSIKIFL